MAQVEDEIARLVIEDGYYVVARTDQLVELERKNSWLGVVIGAVISAGGPGFPRTERIYLHVDEQGEATIRLSRSSGGA